MGEWRVVLRDRVLQTFRLDPGEKVTVGRAAEAGVRIDNPGVSRQHARLAWHNGSWLLEDLGSTNGTRVNGERIEGRVSVQSEDRIEVGKFGLVPVRESADLSKTASPSDIEETVFVGPEVKKAPKEANEAFRLAVAMGQATPSQIALAQKGVVRIGKDPGCDVVVRGWFVAGTQCSLRPRGGAVYVAHHAGFRATRVNGEKIRNEQRLDRGDSLQVAGVTFRVE